MALTAGPRAALLEADPIANCGAGWNAAICLAVLG